MTHAILSPYSALWPEAFQQVRSELIQEFPPIDRSVSDEERAKYGVPPLTELLKAYPEQAKRNTDSD